jgi:hypothetical protein
MGEGRTSRKANGLPEMRPGSKNKSSPADKGSRRMEHRKAGHVKISNRRGVSDASFVVL